MEWHSIHRIPTTTEIRIYFSPGDEGRNWDYDRPWMHGGQGEHHRSLITNAIIRLAGTLEGSTYLASRLKNKIYIDKPLHRNKSHDDRERPHFNVRAEDGKMIHFYTTHSGRMITNTTETTVNTFSTSYE